MTGDFDHLSNRQLADLLAGYHLYGTTRTSEIPGPVMLKLIRKRLRATEPLPDIIPCLDDGKDERVLGLLGERITVKGKEKQ